MKYSTTFATEREGGDLMLAARDAGDTASAELKQQGLAARAWVIHQCLPAGATGRGYPPEVRA